MCYSYRPTNVFSFFFCKQVVVIEDALAGVEAARAAGMQVVWIVDKSITDVQKRKATKTISCLIDFDPKEFSLARAHLP